LRNASMGTRSRRVPGRRTAWSLPAAIQCLTHETETRHSAATSGVRRYFFSFAMTLIVGEERKVLPPVIRGLSGGRKGGGLELALQVVVPVLDRHVGDIEFLVLKFLCHLGKNISLHPIGIFLDLRQHHPHHAMAD